MGSNSWDKAWLVCAPDHYDVTYEINAWMDVEDRPDKALATKQWHGLEETLKKIGCKLHYINQEQDQPDMVFTANGGLVKGNTAILPRFEYAERQGEEPHFENWFKKSGFEIFAPKHSFEGEGDALYAGEEKLFCGYGFRSEKEVYLEIFPVLGIKEKNVIYCELIDPYYYHLDTCFCALNSDIGFYYPNAFTPDSQKDIEKALKVFKVPEEEARHFACNAVVFGKDVVLPTECPSVYEFLQKNGFTPHPIPMTQYIKAGGAAKCLTLKLYN